MEIGRLRASLVSYFLTNLNKEYDGGYGDGGKMTIRIQEEDKVTKEKRASSAVYNILPKPDDEAAVRTVEACAII
jgi:hypothetical protein